MVWLFKSNKLAKHHDIFKCIVNIDDDETQVIVMDNQCLYQFQN